MLVCPSAHQASNDAGSAGSNLPSVLTLMGAKPSCLSRDLTFAATSALLGFSCAACL